MSDRYHSRIVNSAGQLKPLFRDNGFQIMPINNNEPF
jgi:hypothetical protein